MSVAAVVVDSSLRPSTRVDETVLVGMGTETDSSEANRPPVPLDNTDCVTPCGCQEAANSCSCSSSVNGMKYLYVHNYFNGRSF